MRAVLIHLDVWLWSLFLLQHNMERCARGDDGRTLTFYLFLILPFIPLVSQRKSNKAKEKKARRLEERAAMDAICAKVDAANKVTSSSGQARRRFFLLFSGVRLIPFGRETEADI